MDSRLETMHGLLDFLDRQYGGVAGYLEAAGVSRSCMTEISNLLATPADDGKS